MLFRSLLVGGLRRTGLLRLGLRRLLNRLLLLGLRLLFRLCGLLRLLLNRRLSGSRRGSLRRLLRLLGLLNRLLRLRRLSSLGILALHLHPRALQRRQVGIIGAAESTGIPATAGGSGLLLGSLRGRRLILAMLRLRLGMRRGLTRLRLLLNTRNTEIGRASCRERV